MLNKGLFLTEKRKSEFESVTPSGLCLKLRKELTNHRVLDVEQHDFDRILEIKIDDLKLIFEFFGDGNLILTREKEDMYKIVAAFKCREWKDRNIRVGLEYEYPPSAANPMTITHNKLKKLIGSKEIVKTLASDLRLGGEIAEKICSRVKIDKKKIKLTNEEITNLIEFLKNLEKHFGKEYKNANEQLEEKLSSEIARKIHDKDKEKKDKVEMIKLQQKFAVEKWKREEKKSRRKGELIYENYSLLKKILDDLRKLREKKIDWDKIQNKLKRNDFIKSVDPSHAKITFELNNTMLELDFRKTLEKNAEVYFEQAKRAKRKLERISKLKIKLDKYEEEKKKKKMREGKPTRKREWYDKFRWFISSDGYLVVAGKDAKSNERLIRKHMKDDDLIFHADITGSPFVIVKKGKNAPEQTLKEAAEFCAIYSKGWKIGIGTMDVYWVTPDQVVKEGGLPTGSFMIYGKRNWIRRIEMKLAVGIVKNEIIYGPESVVRKKVKDYIILKPGNENIHELLRKKYGKLSKEMMKIIPYGKASL